ncbi:MAG: M48 family metallopeptidase [Pseudomonadota bacterium]
MLPPVRAIVKSGIGMPTAEKLLGALEGCGLLARIEPLALADKPAPQKVVPAATQKKTAPAPAMTPATDDALTVLEQLAQDRKAFKPPRTNALYLLAMALVTLCCILLPVIYISAIVGLGALLVWYASQAPEFARHHHVWATLVWFGIPCLSGAIVLLVLALPLFGGRRKQHTPIRLGDGEELKLRRTIIALCKTIGISPPTHIELSNEVNASVHFHGGWFGILSGNKTLTIGLPLVAGMSSRQFCGVLAHEFGHFAQRIGMRCSYLINRVNGWLDSRAARSAAWRAKLRALREETEIEYLQLAFWLSYHALGISVRAVGWLLNMSFRISQYFSRQMEFDADRYEALIAGSACFRDTSLRLRALAIAHNKVDSINAAAFRERMLLRDMPAATVVQVGRLESSHLKEIEAALDNEETRYWDTHPANNERIRNAEAQKAPGVVLDPQPASSLFSDFPLLCRRVTTNYYKALGLKYSSDQLKDTGDLIDLNELPTELKIAIDAYFNRQWKPSPMLPLHTPATPEQEGLAWQACIDELRHRSPDATQAWQQALDEEKLRIDLAFCIALRSRDIPARLNNGTFEPARHQPQYESIVNFSSPARKTLGIIAPLYRRRAEYAIAAMDDDRSTHFRGRLAALCELTRLGRLAEQLREKRALVRALTPFIDSDIGNQALALQEQALGAHKEIALRLFDQAEHIPFADGNLGAYLRSRCPRAEKPAGMTPYDFFYASSPLPDAVDFVYAGWLGELADACSRIEQEKGIKPINLLAMKKKIEAG